MHLAFQGALNSSRMQLTRSRHPLTSGSGSACHRCIAAAYASLALSASRHRPSSASETELLASSSWRHRASARSGSLFLHLGLNDARGGGGGKTIWQCKRTMKIAATIIMKIMIAMINSPGFHRPGQPLRSSGLPFYPPVQRGWNRAGGCEQCTQCHATGFLTTIKFNQTDTAT